MTFWRTVLLGRQYKSQMIGSSVDSGKGAMHCGSIVHSLKVTDSPLHNNK